MMRFSLFTKMCLCYLVIVILSFTSLNTIGYHQMKNQMIKEQRNLMYNEAQQIKTTYYYNYINDNTSLLNFKQQLSSLQSFIHYRIWIVKKDSSISADSQNILSEDTFINQYDKDFLSHTYQVNTTLNGLLEDNSLSVIFPVSSNFSIQGYIILHQPMSEIHAMLTKNMNFLNCFALCFCILCLLFLVSFYLFVVMPLNKTIKAAKEYSIGNFDYSFQLNTKDEFETLGDTLSFMAGELNNLDDYQKKFVANISHDFRSPLTSIKGYAEAMMDGTIPPEMHEKYLDIILFETQRLTKLTTNLLELNRFENHGTILDITSFDINKTIKRTAAAFEGACLKKHIQLKLIFSEKSLYADADIDKIQQVLYNLLDNAIKFSYTNSKIHISTESKNDKIFVSIKDFGIGIPKDSIKKVWERFYKTDLSRGKDKKGTGLGLSITKEIITAHGETIDVISTEGVGTEFIFTLSKTSDT